MTDVLASRSRARQRLSLLDWTFLLSVFWFGSYLYEYLFTVGGPKPLYSYFAVLAVSLGYALDRRSWGLPVLAREASPFPSWYLWLAFYFCYGAFEFFRSPQDDVAIQAFIYLGESVVLGGAFALIMTERARLGAVAATFSILAIIGSVINVVDFVSPTFSDVPGRAAGLYVNPNISGEFIAIAMTAGFSAVSRRLRVFYLAICAIGVLITFSRESWIIWGLSVMWLSYNGQLGKVRKRFFVLMMGLLIGGGFVTMLFAGEIGAFVAGSSLTEYLTPNTAARIGIGASVLSGDASTERIALISASLREGNAAPWLGHGLGYTSEWRYAAGPHDMYLRSYVEGGLVGLVLYLSLLVILWGAGGGIGRVIAFQIIVSSFFSHNILEQPTSLMLMAFVVAHGAVFREDRAIARRSATPAAA